MRVPYPGTDGVASTSPSIRCSHFSIHMNRVAPLVGSKPVERDGHDEHWRQTPRRRQGDRLIRQQQPARAKHARHVAYCQRLLERLVIDEDVRRHDEIERRRRGKHAP